MLLLIGSWYYARLVPLHLSFRLRLGEGPGESNKLREIWMLLTKSWTCHLPITKKIAFRHVKSNLELSRAFTWRVQFRAINITFKPRKASTVKVIDQVWTVAINTRLWFAFIFDINRTVGAWEAGSTCTSVCSIWVITGCVILAEFQFALVNIYIAVFPFPAWCTTAVIVKHKIFTATPIFAWRIKTIVSIQLTVGTWKTPKRNSISCLERNSFTVSWICQRCTLLRGSVTQFCPTFECWNWKLKNSDELCLLKTK